MKFKKKPVVIDATENDNPFHVILWAEQFDGSINWMIDGEKIIVSTLEGEMTVNKGDWIIRGVNGEFYPCKPDIFAQTYEPAKNLVDNGLRE